MIRRFLDWLFHRPVDAVPDDDTDMIEEMEKQQ